MSTTDIKKLAKKLSKMGRYGDTELVHLNKEEKELIEKYRGDKLSINPKTGLKEGFIQKAVQMGIDYKLGQLQSGAKSLIKKQQIKEQKAELDKLKKIQPREAQAMSRLRETARTGSVDMSSANRQISQPTYQRGQSAKAAQLGQMTRQGLEGSIVAQEVSRKLDSNVRASIAEQARQIAFQNEQSKIRAQENLQKSLFKRGDLLRQIAAKKEGLGKKTTSSIMQSQLNKALGRAQFLGNVFGEAEKSFDTFRGDVTMQRELDNLQKQYNSGNMSSDEYIYRYRNITGQKPFMPDDDNMFNLGEPENR